MALIPQLISLLALSAAASPVRKRVYPSPGPCTGTCSGLVHDPSVVYREDTKTYYRFTSNNKITISTAPAMLGPWTVQQRPALMDGSSIDLPGNQDIWAPNVHFSGDTYYLYYSVSAIGSNDSDIGVATSPTMEVADWIDHGSIGIPNNTLYNKIDPNLLLHEPGARPLLTFGSFWGGIFQVAMANPLNVALDMVHLAQNTTVRPAGLVAGAMEGGYQFMWNGYFYLFFSSGNCCNLPTDSGGLAPAGEEYHIMVCRSTLPYANFRDQSGKDCLTDNGGTMVLASQDDVYAPGGQGVMYDPNLRAPVMYYHYVRPSVSYAYDDFFFGWNLLDFSSGWPVVVA